MKLFGIIGVPELIIILIIVCLLFGPSLFKKINSQVRKTGKAAKAAVENGAKAAGTEVDLNAVNKDVIMNKVENLQDRVDKMFESAEEDSETAEATTKKDDASA